MEYLSKYVLEKAGEKYDQFFLPESKCIGAEDLEVQPVHHFISLQTVLSSVHLPEPESLSRQYLHGSSICIDSISTSRIESSCNLITSYFHDFIEVEQLDVTPSPLLQSYMLCQPAMDDGVTITTYCERTYTVGICENNGTPNPPEMICMNCSSYRLSPKPSNLELFLAVYDYYQP